MADTASTSKARREPPSNDLTDLVVIIMLAVAAATGWVLFWISVCCVTFSMMATCVRICFEVFAPAGLKRNRIQARAAQYAWRCGTQTSRPAAKAAIQPMSPSGSDVPAHGQSETTSWPSSIPGPGSVQPIQQQAVATVAVTEAVTNPSSSDKSATTASDDAANTASAGSDLARRVQHEELEWSTVEKEQQQFNWEALHAQAAACGTKPALCPGETEVLRATGNMDLNSRDQLQAHAPELDTDVVELQTICGEDNLLNTSSATSLSDESAAAASNWSDWANMIAASAAADLAHKKQPKGLDLSPGCEKEVSDIIPVMDWEEQQQCKREPLCGRAACGTKPALSPGEKEVQWAAGKAAQEAATAHLASQLQEIDVQLCSMDLNSRDQFLQAHIEDLEIEGLDWQATYNEDCTQLPEDVLAMVDEAVAKAYSHPLAVICCELEL